MFTSQFQMYDSGKSNKTLKKKKKQIKLNMLKTKFNTLHII